MARLSAAARHAIDNKPGDPDHDFGALRPCRQCGATVLAAKWMGLEVELEAAQVPIRHPLGPGRFHRGVKQWHPLPVGQWSTLFGERDSREIRFMHYLKCPGGNSAAGSTQQKGTTP